ncbi:MAG TPA: HAMP domain-containing sensor histidine kinase [Nitrososphaeraceae archaeon]|nr:HAMP domain-containing sensor histidine kinase [Nitrososphaeraceae archaeon]
MDSSDGSTIGIEVTELKGSGESSNQGKCTLCGKEIGYNSIADTVEGRDYEFDSPQCAIMFKRLKSVYGERLTGLLGLEQFISDPFWSRVTPDEREMIQMHDESQRLLHDQDVVKIVEEPDKIIQTAFEMIRSARKEVLIMFSTANAFKRQVSIGGPQLLKEVTSLRKDLDVRILTPADMDVELSSVTLATKLDTVSVRNMQATLQSKVTVLVVDRRLSLAIELKDDSQEDIQKALRSAIYSNTKSAAISYVAIFESLWKQVELIERVNSLYSQLKDQQTNQREFISIAAHELRAPIQPILGLAEVLKSRQEVQMEKQRELLSVIIRNAKRLKELTENILDITRIENKSLELQMEPLDIDEIVIGVLNDALEEAEHVRYVRLVYKHNKSKKFDSFSPPSNSKDDSFTQARSAGQLPSPQVRADRSRLTQVMTNLVGNAIKFSNDGGTVTVSVSEGKTRNYKRRQKGKMDSSRKVLLVQVEDTGKGIDPEIFPRLFTKFTSKSEKGMGLGLYISKKIVEAHGGEIWADTPPNKEKGATFSFTIPVG